MGHRETPAALARQAQDQAQNRKQVRASWTRQRELMLVTQIKASSPWSASKRATCHSE